MSKKSLLIIAIISLLPLTGLFADVISKPAATVNLIRNKIISVSELEERVSAYEAEARASGSSATIKPSEMLEILINDELVLQGAERDGYSLSDAQVEQLMRQQKATAES